MLNNLTHKIYIYVPNINCFFLLFFFKWLRDYSAKTGHGPFNECPSVLSPRSLLHLRHSPQMDKLGGKDMRTTSSVQSFVCTVNKVGYCWFVMVDRERPGKLALAAFFRFKLLD